MSIKSLITILWWKDVKSVHKYLDKNGQLSPALVLQADGDIREAWFDSDKGLFFCESDGSAYEFDPMNPQPIKFAFKPRRK